MTPLKEIKLLSCEPLFDVDPWGILPGERTALIGLIASIDLHGVMGTRAPQASPLIAVAHIFEGSRIDQKISPVSNQPNAQCIGVSMPSSPCS